MTYFFWLHVHGLRGTRRTQIFFYVPYEPQASIGKTHGRHGSLAPAARTFSHFLSLILKGFYLHFSLCLSPCGSDPVALHPHGYRLIASPMCQHGALALVTFSLIPSLSNATSRGTGGRRLRTAPCHPRGRTAVRRRCWRISAAAARRAAAPCGCHLYKGPAVHTPRSQTPVFGCLDSGPDATENVCGGSGGAMLRVVVFAPSVAALTAGSDAGSAQDGG